MLEKFCIDPALSRTVRKNMKMDFKKFSADYLINDYKEVLYLENTEDNIMPMTSIIDTPTNLSTKLLKRILD